MRLVLHFHHWPTVLNGDPAPLPKKGAEPPIFGRFLLCQTAGCIKMPLSMEEGLRPGHIVIDADPAPLPKKEAEPPNFRPILLWPNGFGWMHQDAT